MTSGGGVVEREKRRYGPGEACEELDHVEVLLGGGAGGSSSLLGGGSPPGPVPRPRPCGSRPPVDRLLRPPVCGIVVCEEGEQAPFSARVLCELAVLVVGASVVGEHRDALCEVGHDGLSLLFAEIPGIEGLDEDLPDPAWSGSCPPGTIRTPRRVREILIEALDARDLGEKERQAVVADLTERFAMLADDAQPHDENRKLAKHLYGEKEALSTFLTHDGVDATELAGGAGDPPGGGEPQGRAEQDLAGAATQARMMSLIRTAAQQNLDVIEFLTRLARAPTPEDVPPLFARTILLRSSFIEMG